METSTLLFAVACCTFLGLYGTVEKKWGIVIVSIIVAFLCGLPLYFRMLAGML